MLYFGKTEAIDKGVDLFALPTKGTVVRGVAGIAVEVLGAEGEFTGYPAQVSCVAKIDEMPAT